MCTAPELCCGSGVIFDPLSEHLGKEFWFIVTCTYDFMAINDGGVYTKPSRTHFRYRFSDLVWATKESFTTKNVGCGARTGFFHPHPELGCGSKMVVESDPQHFLSVELLNHPSVDVNKCHHEHSSRGQIGLIPEMPGLKLWFFKIRTRSWNLTKRLKTPHEYSQQRKTSSFLWLFGSKPSILVILYNMKIHCPAILLCVFQAFDPWPYLFFWVTFKWRPNNFDPLAAHLGLPLDVPYGQSLPESSAATVPQRLFRRTLWENVWNLMIPSG